MLVLPWAALWALASSVALSPSLIRGLLDPAANTPLFRLLVPRAGRAVIPYWHLRPKGSSPCFSDAIEIIIVWVWGELDPSGL
jgi:hypothetical protein